MSNSNGNCDPAVDNRGKNDRPTRNTGRSNPSPELLPQITPYLHTLLFPGSAPSETGIALLTSGSLLISRQRIKIIDIRPHPRHLGGTRKIALVGPCCASVLDFRGRPPPDGSLDTGHGRVDERAKLPLSLSNLSAVTKRDDTAEQPWANRRLPSATRLHGALLGALPSVRFQLSATALVHCYPV